MFSITYDKMAVAGDEGKENASEIFSELEAADVERISERAVGCKRFILSYRATMI